MLPEAKVTAVLLALNPTNDHWPGCWILKLEKRLLPDDQWHPGGLDVCPASTVTMGGTSPTRQGHEH